jgi:hypothetical protein
MRGPAAIAIKSTTAAGGTRALTLGRVPIEIFESSPLGFGSGESVTIRDVRGGKSDGGITCHVMRERQCRQRRFMFGIHDVSPRGLRGHMAAPSAASHIAGCITARK